MGGGARRRLSVGVIVGFVARTALQAAEYLGLWCPLGDSNPCYRRERAVS